MATMGFSRADDEQNRRLDAADRSLRRALELDPRNLGIHRQLAATAIERSQSSQARRLLAEAESMVMPDDLEYRFQLGRLYEGAGYVSRGIAVWVSLGRRDQLLNWGERLSRRGSWKNAAQVYRAAIDLAPNDPAPYAHLADAVRRDDGREAARAALLRISAEHPQVPWPLLEIGDLWAREGDNAQARLWYEKAAALAPDQASIRQRLASS
jgi:tetratricopeptide (TPR) repeat protein